MQAYTSTSLPSRNYLPYQWTTACLPTTQNGYCSVQQGTLTQQNNDQSLCLNNAYAISSSSQPNSSSANLQSCQTPKVQKSKKNAKSQYYLSSASSRPAYPNVSVCNAPLRSGQLGTHAENLSYNPQSSYSNTTNQLVYKRFPSVSSNGGSATFKENLMYGSNSPQYQSFPQTTFQTAHHQQTVPSTQISQSAPTANISHGQMGTVGNGTYSSFTYSSMPQHYITQQGSFSQGQSQGIVNQIHNVSAFFSQPVTSRIQYMTNNGPNSLNLPLPPTSQSIYNAAIQSQSTHMMNQNLTSSLSQEKNSSQVRFLGAHLEEMSRQSSQHHNTSSVSGQHRKTVLPASPGNPCNTGPYIQQSTSTTSGLTRTSQDTTRITPTSEAPPTYADALFITRMNLLPSKDGRQVPVQRHDHNSLFSTSNNCESQVSHSRGELQQAAQGQSATQSMASSQVQTSLMHGGIPATSGNGESWRIREHQTCDKSTDVSVAHGRVHGCHLEAQDVETRCKTAQSNRPQMVSRIKKNNGQMSKERQGKVQYCMDPADCLEVVMALYREARQTNRAVAVVPPIYQQAASPEEDVTPSPDKCMPKIDAVWSCLQEGDDLETSQNSLNQPNKITEDQFKAASMQWPELQKNTKAGNGSTVDVPSCEVTSSKIDLTHECQSGDTPQSVNVPVSTLQCSNMHQNATEDPISSLDLKSKCPIQQNDENDFYLKNSFDIARAPLVDFTLEKVKDLVKNLELQQVEREQEKEATDVSKCILDVFWDGDEQNVQKQLKEALAAELLKTAFEVGVKENHAVVFRYLDLEILKTSNCYHILENETTLPTEESRPSGLLSDQQPTDLECGLEEPISEYDVTCPNDISMLQLDSTVNRDSNLVQVSADNPENTDLSTHKDVCDTTSNNVSLKNGNGNNHCEVGNISDDANASCDSLLMKVTLLSSDDAKKTFKEHSFHDQLKDSSLYQNDPKDSAIMSPTEPDHVRSEGELMFHRTHSQIRFTCPHVTVVVSDDDHFCSKCWAETPLLDLALEEVTFTPKEGELSNTIPSKPENQCQNSGPQSGKEPVDPVCADSGSIAMSEMLTPKCGGSDIMKADPKPDEGGNRTSASEEPQDLELLQSDYLPSGSIIKPVPDKICNFTASPRAESPKDFSDMGNIVMSNVITPKFDGSDIMTSNPKADEGQSYNSMCDERQVQESLQPVCKSSALAMSAADVVTSPKTDKTLLDMATMKYVKPVSQPQTKTLKQKVSPPLKKLKRKRAAQMPADDLFVPDIVVKRFKRSHEPVPTVRLHTYSCDGQNSIDEKEGNVKGEKKRDGKDKHSLVKIASQTNQPSTQAEQDAQWMCQKAPAQHEVPDICKTVQSWNAVPQKKKSSKSQHKKKVKRSNSKIRLVLYGPQSNNLDKYFVHRCPDRKKALGVPTVVTISPSHAASNNYSNMPTARQKVYSDWSSTFVHVSRKKKTVS